MTPRPEDDALTQPEVEELKRNLLLLSGSSVESFYRDAHKECSLERRPNPKAIQRLVTAWKVLRGWGWK